MFKFFYILFFGILFVSCSSNKDKNFIESDIKKVETSFKLEEQIKKKFELKLENSNEEVVSKPIEKKQDSSQEKESEKKKATISQAKKEKNPKKSSRHQKKKNIKTKISSKIDYPKDYPERYISYDKKSKKTWKSFEPKIYVGEEYLFRVSYLGITAGRIKLTTLPPAKVGGEEVFHFRAQLRSARYYSAIYSLDDSLDSFVDMDGFIPVKYVLKQQESAQEVDDLQLFDREELKTFFWYKRIKENANKEEHKIEFIPYYFQDSFSALHFVRGLPLKLGDVYEFPIMTRAKLWILKIEVDREEILEIADEKVRALRLKAETRFPGVLKKRGDISFWYSNDEKKRLLKFEAEVKIGSIAGELEEYSSGEELEID